MSSFKNQEVVVTGASGGIGQASVVGFGRAGAAVALLASGREGLTGAAKEIQPAGGRTLTIEVDTSDHAALDLAATGPLQSAYSRLSHKAQPVSPICQPEVAAGGVLYAAEHPQRREYWVGSSAAGTLLANVVAPGLLDRYLARTGFSSQQTPEPEEPHQLGAGASLLKRLVQR